jgi:predicted amidohydrolase
MKVTVCELPAEHRAFHAAWDDAIAYVRRSGSEIVVLPRLTFDEWVVESGRRSEGVIAEAAPAQDAWNHSLARLAPSLVLGSCTIEFGNERYEEGYFWEPEVGLRSVHARACDPDDQSQYSSHVLSEFTPLEVRGMRVAFLIGNEVRDEAEAERYGREDVDLIVATPPANREAFTAWFDWARRAAAASRAFVVSSVRSGAKHGWSAIIDPDGEVLVRTSASDAFCSRDLDLPIERNRLSDPVTRNLHGTQDRSQHSGG